MKLWAGGRIMTLAWFLEEVWESLLVTSVLLMAGWVYNWMDEKADICGHCGWRVLKIGAVRRGMSCRCELEWETKNRQSFSESNQTNKHKKSAVPDSSSSQARAFLLVILRNDLHLEQKSEEFKVESMFIQLQLTLAFTAPQITLSHPILPIINISVHYGYSKANVSLQSSHRGWWHCHPLHGTFPYLRTRLIFRLVTTWPPSPSLQEKHFTTNMEDTRMICW